MDRTSQIPIPGENPRDEDVECHDVILDSEQTKARFNSRFGREGGEVLPSWVEFL